MNGAGHRGRRGLARAAAVAGWLAAALALAQAQPPAADLDAVLARHREAMGGAEAWASWSTLRLTGTISAGDDRATPCVISYARGRPGRFPPRVRLDFEVQGLPGVIGFDGERAWMRSPFEPAIRRVAAEESVRWRRIADLAGPLLGATDEDVEIELVEDSSAGRPRLRLRRPSGEISELWLDEETYRIRRETTVLGRAMAGRAQEVETLYSDYRKVGRLVLPHRVESRATEATAGQLLLLQEVEVDPPLSADLFLPPPQ